MTKRNNMRTIRVALINPLAPSMTRTGGPPLGLGYIRAFYERHGSNVVEFRLFDENARPLGETFP